MLPLIDQSQLTLLSIHELKMYAPVQVGDRSVSAFLDTGANQVSISEELAAGLPRIDETRTRSAFGETTYDVVNVDFTFLDASYHDKRARILPPTQADIPFQTGVTLDAPTIFSQPILFDFHLLAIARPAALSGVAWQPLPARFTESGLCFVQLAAESAPVWALFDTGAGFSVINSTHLPEIGLQLRPGYQIEVTDATETKAMQQVDACVGLTVHDRLFPPFDAFSVDLTGIETALDHRIDMILGANAMLQSGLRWLFDREQGDVRVAG